MYIDILNHEISKDKLDIKITSEIIGSTTGTKGLNLQYCKDDISTNIKILLEEDLKGLSIYIMIESICKDIDIEDYIMDDILYQSSKIVKIIKRRLDLEKHFMNINMDTLVTAENSINEWANDKIRQYINEICEDIQSKGSKTFNYSNELFVFGAKGKRISRLIEEMYIATVVRSNGGYLIRFLDEKIDGCNEPINIFAKKLSKIGVPSLSIPLITLDNYWQ